MKHKYYSVLLIVIGALGLLYSNCKIINRRNEQLNTVIKQRDFLERWLTMKEQGISVERYLKENGLKNVGIYGLGLLGNHLYEDLKESCYVEKLIGIDRADIHDNYKMVIKKPNDNLDELDIIIITTTSGFKEIENELRYHYDGVIVSLERILSECENYYTYEL